VPAVLREHPATVLETAIEYGNAGLWPDAVAVLDSAPGAGVAAAYYLAYATEQAGDAAKATACYASAANASLALAFPYQGELIAVFRRALEVNPRDARAAYLLGNLLFDQQPEAAIASWEQAIALDSSNAIALRNLAMAYARQRNDLPRAIKTLETAVALGQPYPLHFFELDQLYEESGAAPEKRLAMLESHHDLVARRDDALAREVSLLVALGREEDALALMKDRRFNVWEGGARFQMHDYWTSAHLLRGHKARATGKAAEALAAYQAALVFPANLQVARFRTGGRFPEANYWIGVAETALGRTNEAREAWAQAAAELPEVGEDDILAATDRTVQAYFQALALRKLGREAEATALFERLIKSGEKALTEGRTVGVFAKFGEGQTERARVARAHYLIGLGQAGLGQAGEARASFRKALEAAPDHDGARMALGGWVQ
jgi:tetratricopeptide (TPR) repeat protein